MAGNTTAEPGLVTPPSQNRFEALRTALAHKNTEDWHTLDSILADADEKRTRRHHACPRRVCCGVRG